ncbi:hydrogenase nickel incorporation protein HypA [Neosynechococcus sphagnicola sy1]|uniref:Hydrogenase maturation factor HypA n=1 Tax=Neosynechococcus sphagnicola sy1 TaxID=1497020 RepID=A0A098TGY1_9CYAN|nr:hydrogenase maturation nickel metallochaperone HypA [Neosynechococcus sphagnicola]KGF71845.1 hydrogenase nickel incorporation protein HypA [Neosynechococcus sphagnicola sy1]
MHELGLLENTLELALGYAQQQGASQIHRLTLRVGQLSGVMPEALRFAFDVVVQGTIAANAELEIETIPAICYCPTCQQDFQPPDWIYECPDCHQLCTQLLQGRDLELVSLEVS